MSPFIISAQHAADRLCVCAPRWPSATKGEYAELFRDVARAIREGTTPAVKWEESAQVIEMIELALMSSKEGRTLDVSPRA